MLVAILKAILFGIVEGITEWLPVSSTGHMILLNELVKLDVSPAFWEMFLVVIQLGAILAVVAAFFTRLVPFLPGQTSAQRRGMWTLWGKILTACLPAAIIGVLLGDKIDALFYNWPTVAAALIVYGAVFIILERRAKINFPIRDTAGITYKNALLIGIFQLLALIPGTSRSGATIIGAMLLGCSREIAAEFSFFLAVPVILGASALKLAKFGLRLTGAELVILTLGMAVAFLVSLAAVRFLMGFVKKHSFRGFGWYRLALGFLVVIWFCFAA